MHKFLALTSAAALLVILGGPAIAASNDIPRPAPYGQPPSTKEVRQLAPMQPAPSSSSGWVRPYTAGDGGLGAVGGYQTRGGTSVNGNVYLYGNGGATGGVSVATPTR